jgi:poly-gamma-glutamate capsule biosynthesis protein CapA/YwtB (metallophosphatase superfamily)
VVTMGNNHAVDFGRVGLEDTLRAVRRSPVPVVGIGRNQSEAFRPYIATVKGTEIAFLAASSRRERTSAAWGAGPDSPGIAAAGRVYSPPLLAAVRSAAERADVVVVYLHWGTELQQCPGTKQRMVARVLAEAGADVIVGTHAHVPLGAGWLGESYVSYGLGNFVWYHNRIQSSGVVRVRIVDGKVVDDAFTPARIEPDGLPHPLAGAEAEAATARRRALRGCTGLAAGPPA